MSPAERALLIAIGQVVAEGTGRLRLMHMMAAVQREDERRPFNERMPEETFEEYNLRAVPLVAPQKKT